MTGTGFIKCIPITLSGLLLADPIFVIEIEDVFDANIVFGDVIELNSLNIEVFNARSSFTASITKSTLLKSFRVFVVVILFF